MANQLSILNEEQVRSLATVIRYQEANAIQTLNFSTAAEQDKYLFDSKSNYDTILALLDAGSELKRKFENNGDQVRGPIADDIFSYFVYSANIALQTVQNYTLRMEYLKKFNEHANSLMDELKKEELDPQTAKDQAEEAAMFATITLEYLRNYQSTASRNFSEWIKNSGMTLEQLVQRYQAEAGYGGLFKDLKDEEKIMVYDKIIQASGRGRVYAVLNKRMIGTEASSGSEFLYDESKFPNVSAFGIASLLFTASNMTWDIYTAEHKIQVATRDAVKVAASKIGGALITEVVAIAIRTEAAEAIGATALFTVLGTVTSFVGAFIIGAFAGWLFDLFFSSGGAAPLSTQGLKCYVATLPDGIVLARQIAHPQQLEN